MFNFRLFLYWLYEKEKYLTRCLIDLKFFKKRITSCFQSSLKPSWANAWVADQMILSMIFIQMFSVCLTLTNLEGIFGNYANQIVFQKNNFCSYYKSKLCNCVFYFFTFSRKVEGKIEVTETHLILIQTGRDPIKWPLKSLRRYGFEAGVFR